MALVPCKVCGSLNPEHTEICLSCGYPTQGHKRSPIFQWTAIGLFFMFTIPLILSFMGWVNLQFKKPKNQTRPTNLTQIKFVPNQFVPNQATLL